jgi:MFS family permease
MTGGPAVKPPGGPRSFAALHHRDYRVYFVTTALAMMADNIEHVISYWVMFEKFHSPTLGGVAVITHWVPFLLFSVYSGALADRFDNRRIIQIAMLLYMAVSAAWAVLFLTDTIQEWHAIVLLTIHGLAGVLWGPSSQILIHDIVGTEHLQSAVRLNATGRTLGVLLGPAVGGGLMLLLGAPGGLLANVLIYLPLAWWLWKTPYGARARRAQPSPAQPGGMAGVMSTVRLAAGNRTIMTMIALAGVSSFFIGSGYQPQMPEFAHDLGTDHVDLSYSVLLAANAAGAVTGGIVLESRGLLQSSPRTAIVLTILWCLAMGGFAQTTHFSVAVTLMFVAGFLNLTFSSMAQTLVQLHAPPPLRGRFIGLFNMSNNGLRAFSGVTIGFLGSAIGIHTSLALSALALLVVAMALLAFSMRSK